MALTGTDSEKFKQLCQKTHKEQAIWFLNYAIGKIGEKNADLVYRYVQKFEEIDKETHNKKVSLDELNAHRFLEFFKETMTVMEMRNKLRSVGALSQAERPKDFPITHFLIARFDASWTELVNAPQAENAEEIDRCQKMLKAVQDMIPELEAAEAESKAAARVVQEEQKKYDDRTKELQNLSETGGAVARNKAKNELAQHLATETLPLKKAKITAEAAAARAEKALKKAKQQIEDLEKELHRLMAAGGSGQGALYWINRELHEAKKFMPLSKGGIARK